MRILHVMPDLDPSTGGPVSAVIGMAEAQAQAGHTVSIAATGSVLSQSLSGVELFLFPLSFSAWKFSRALGDELPRLISGADIVHIHMMWDYPAWKAARLCMKAGKPYILRPCGMLDEWSLSQSPWKKKIYLQIFGNAMVSGSAAIHYTSDGEKRASLPIKKRVSDFVLPNGLPETAWETETSALSFRKRVPKAGARAIVLYLGRLHYKKQPDVAIKAFMKLRAVFPDSHLVMAGDGEDNYVSDLRHLAVKSGLQDDVTFTGPLLGEEKRSAFSAASVFLLPSLRENFGIAVAEAMAAGCPVVVSPGVDIAEDIVQAEAGIVCPPEPVIVSESLAKILNSPALSSTMGENGRKLTLEKYRWSKITGQLIGLYAGVLKSKRYNHQGKRNENSWT